VADKAAALGDAIEAPDAPARRPSDLGLAIRGLLRRPPALFGLVCCTVVFVWALVPALFSPMDPLEQDLERYLKPPGYVDPAGKTYWLGTDQQGRDVLSRVIWGSRISLVVGITTVVVSGVIGVFLGILAGYKGGWVDTVIGRTIDTLFAVPFVLLAMSLVAILGASLQNIILAIALRTWIVYARVVRGEALSLRAQDFVSAAKAMGCGTTRILLLYLLPNVMASTIVVATLNLGRMIIIESSLSFLGLGVPPPAPTWGGMLAEGRTFLDTAWWIAFFPGVVLMLTVLGTNLLGDWLRDILDPRLKRLGD
jgi:peptide/nickel transport system permease protein